MNLMKRNHLYASLALVLGMTSSVSLAQTAPNPSTADQTSAATQRSNASSTSNTSTSNDTKRAQQLSTVQVSAQSLSLGGGLMSVQTAPKAVSTITRDAIIQASPGSNFTQLIASVPGVNSSTDDVTGLSDGNFSIRGFASNEIGVTVNGAPLNDSGSYAVYASEFGDSENIGDITVMQGMPDLDLPDVGAAGGHIAWATIDPSHTAGLDITESYGSHDYHRTFVRANTGDTGPVRSWLSFSDNSVDLWRGAGNTKIKKVDGKSLWTIDDNNSVSASLQYNREVRIGGYESLTKAAAAGDGYFKSWDTTYKPNSADNNFYQLHTNPFMNYMFSLDGEFTLADNLHLSVIPYFQYGDGGSGSGDNFFAETTYTGSNELEDANQDLNQDGQIVKGPNGKKAIAYSFSHSTTWRPGVLFKFNQDLGMDNSLEYGFWYEKARQEQSETYGLASLATGIPNDLWGDSNYIYYPDGQIQKGWDDYTTTESKKVFITDTWTPNDQWLFTLGAAYLHAERTGFSLENPGNEGGFNTPAYGGNFDANYHKVTPSFGAKFQLDEHNQIFYGLGETYRAPPTNAVSFNAITSSPLNKPESSWTNDLGWRYYGDMVSASAEIYRSNFNNRTVSGFDDALDLAFYTQISRVKQQGFNAEASFKLGGGWKIYSSYTYTQSKVESNFDAGDDGIYPTIGKTMINAPRNMGYVALNYDNGPFWASLSSSYKSAIWGDFMNTEKVGGFTTFGLNAGYHLPDFADWFKKPYIKINLANLTDRHALTFATNSSTLSAKTAGFFNTPATYSLLEPRTFMVTIGASFF
jgi:iron complex outermembrane receptor protein